MRLGAAQGASLKFWRSGAMCNGKIVLYLALILAFTRPASQPAAAPAASPTETSPLLHEAWDGEVPAPEGGCTTVYASDGKQMLGGNNEDSLEPLTKVWFVPAGEGTFGLVFFGYSNYRPQGGMNDQGLFFDLLSVPKELPIPLEGKQPYPGLNYMIYDAIARCAKVACVAEMFEKFYDVESWSMQAFFGDAAGESLIIEPQTMLRQRGGYQVATNFYQSTVAPELRVNACPRYKAASELLESAPALSVETLRDVMAAAHQGGPWSQTVYTNVYDLVNRKVYLYYFHDYAHVAVIDLQEELAKGAHAYDLAALFPPNRAALEFFAPALSSYDNVIRSRRVEIDPAFLAAYVGEYAPPQDEPRKPGEWVSVVPYGSSLMMIFPDSHRYELFPRNATSFFVVTWDRMNERFQVQFDVVFGVDEATGQVLYMDFVFGPGEDYVRNERLGLESYAPPIPTATASATLTPTATATLEPSATTAPTDTATLEPTQAPSLTPTAAAPTLPAPASQAGLPWGWVILPVVLLVMAAGWVVIRRTRATRR